jgi:16S rRNA (cytidine1402-2'-O)-methyltransferase
MPGILYIVATPIGNLEDITLRALRILREVDAIACEDTRQSRKLLDHHGVAKRLIPLHDHNERERVAGLIAELEAGSTAALISDAGTPLISDPGFRLVREARARLIPVIPIPGPSAVMAAVAASGLPTDAFYFGGFLPAKSAARRAELQTRAQLEATLIYFEAPHRLLDTLADCAAILPGRTLVIARELTKVHEEFATGAAAALLADFEQRNGGVRGEITLLIGKASQPGEGVSPGQLSQELAELLSQGYSKSEAAREIAERHGVPRREAYQLAMELPGQLSGK